MVYGEIYVVTCLVNEKIYVGQTTRGISVRWKGHTKRSSERVSLLTRAITKYGTEVFTIKVVDTANTQEELDTKEVYWILTLGTVSPMGYNLTEGGKGGKMSPEAVEKNRQAHLGKKVSPEHARHLRQSRLGKTNSPEHMEKIRQFHLGRKRSDESRAKMSAAAKARSGDSTKAVEWMRQANLGGAKSPEVRAKMSASMKGLKRSPEGCDHIRQAKLKMTQETKEKIRQAALRRVRKPHSSETREKMRLSAIEAHRVRRENRRQGGNQ